MPKKTNVPSAWAPWLIAGITLTVLAVTRHKIFSVKKLDQSLNKIPTEQLKK